MDTFAPLIPPGSAMQRIADAQDALLSSGAGVPGPAYIQAFHGAKHNESVADLMPEQAANLIYVLTGAGEHTRTLLAYALRGLGFRIVAVAHHEPVAPDNTQPLTSRHQDLMRLLARGLSNKQMAAELGITEATVKVHMKSMFAKMGVRNRTQAALLAAKAGAA